MKMSYSVVSPVSTFIFLDFGQVAGTGIIPSPPQIVYTTSSLTLTQLDLLNFTLDMEGFLDVHSSYIFMFTNNSDNAVCKLQISGDGGSTFSDVTDEIEDGGLAFTAGAALWITSVQVGNNKLQLKLLGRSTDGNPASIRIRHGTFMQLDIFKRLT